MSGSKESQVDPELKEMVVHALEKVGVLTSIRAQLRAATFLALEGHEQFPPFSPHVKFLTETENGKLCLQLIQDFLIGMDLQQSHSVFKAEVRLDSNLNRRETADALSLEASDEPLLLQMVNKLRKLEDIPHRDGGESRNPGTPEKRSVSEDIKDDFDDELGF